MKRKVLPVLLAVEAVVCISLCFLKISLANVFSAAIAFPFEQIGMGLRTLSLSGGFGNTIALVIYFIVGLLPAGTLLVLHIMRKQNMEDWLLMLLTAILFGVLFLMINPGFITEILGIAARPPIGKALLGGIVYSLLVGYFILRVLRLFTSGNTQKLERYMLIMLGVLNVLFVFIAFGVSFSNMLASIYSLQAGNSGNEHLLGTSYAFIVLQYVVNALPYILDVVVVFAALRLLGEIRKERYSTESVAAAERMSRLCAIALAVTTLTNIVFNLLQLLFAKSLMAVNNSVQIPVLSIFFVLAALLLTRFIIENKKLKDENDQFI
jgi:hypothetical protein